MIHGGRIYPNGGFGHGWCRDMNGVTHSSYRFMSSQAIDQVGIT
jgi:hypothetical protein